MRLQATMAPAVATKVLIIASVAPPLASRLEPTLKPNQPTQRIEAPIRHERQRVRRHHVLAVARRWPIMMQPTSAGDAGVDVHDGAAGEVDGAHLEE